MVFFMLAVIETILLEEPSGAHVALFIPLWMLDGAFVGKVCCQCFVDKHAEQILA